MTRPDDTKPGDVEFFPLTPRENQRVHGRGVNPVHATYECGACGQSTNGRVLCLHQRKSDGRTILWCVCSCEQAEPSILVEGDGEVISQLPISQKFQAHDAWPSDLSQLYTEAARAYGAGAFTACAMVCRKLLMSTACHQGETDGKSFVDYVTYLTDEVLKFPAAKSAIDKIRGIGNEANHNLRFVSQDDARRAMEIVTYLLNTIYALPAA